MFSKDKATLKRAKGPAGLPLMGNLLQAIRDPLRFVMDLASNYEDVSYFRIGIYTGYLLNHTDYFKHVLQENYNYRMLKPVLGEGLISANHDQWVHDRKLIQPIFHSKRISGIASTITKEINQMLECWGSYPANSQPISFSSEMMKLTLRIITQSLFSSDIRSTAENFGRAFTIINQDISD